MTAEAFKNNEQGGKLNDKELVDLWASRNTDLHLLARKLLEKLRIATPDDPFLYEAEGILADVPNIRAQHERGFRE